MNLVRRTKLRASSLLCCSIGHALLLVWMVILPIAVHAMSLPELEDMLDDSREVEIATAEIEERIYLLKRERLRRGVKLFANAGYSDVSEVVTDDLRREYQRKHMTMGLSYPLFGTHAIEKNAVLEAEENVYASEQRRAITRQRALATLRRSYIDYWTAIQRLRVSGDFLSIEENTNNWLIERTKTGHVLEADRLEFMTAFDLARRATASDEEIRSRSLSAMALLTEDSLPPFEPHGPELPSACLDKSALREMAIAQHPELKLLRARRDTLRSLRKRSNDIEGNVNISTSLGRDEPSSLSDNGLAFSVNVRMPLEFLASRKYSRYAKSAELRRANLELDKRTQEVSNDIHSAIGRYRTAIENLSFAETRVTAALETVRERQLRAASLPGDTMEKLQQAKFSVYRTSTDLIDAEGLLLKATVGLLSFSERSCLPLEPNLQIEPEYEPIILAKPLPKQWASTLDLQALQPRLTELAKSPVETQQRGSPKSSDNDYAWSLSSIKRVYYETIMPRVHATIATFSDNAPKDAHTIMTPSIEEAESKLQSVKSAPRVRVRFEDAFSGVQEVKLNSSFALLNGETNKGRKTESAAPSARAQNASTGIYLWKSRRLISNQTLRKAFWKKLEARNIDRVLLSLDGHQIRSSAKGLQQRNLRQFLKEGKDHGIKVELLLGEPSWVLESQRPKLYEIVDQLARFEFQGLHLDIEPGMFDERLYDRKEILQQLGDTVEGVVERSPWPISLSLHYRDLDDSQPYCLGCRLSSLDVKEVTLMIYVSNPTRVAEIARRVARRNPLLSFSVAQSVEPILGKDESYAHLDPNELESRLDLLRNKLAPFSVSSILLQSWSDLEAMSE